MIKGLRSCEVLATFCRAFVISTCKSGFQENQQKLERFFIEIVSKSIFKYLGHWEVENVKKRSVIKKGLT
jgi:hypothetical protein